MRLAVDSAGRHPQRVPQLQKQAVERSKAPKRTEGGFAKERLGLVRQSRLGLAVQALNVQVSLGVEKFGFAGEDRPGMVGGDRPEGAWQAWNGMDRRSVTWPGRQV